MPSGQGLSVDTVRLMKLKMRWKSQSIALKPLATSLLIILNLKGPDTVSHADLDSLSRVSLAGSVGRD
eukprot:3941999-Rhodomonas_salina.5